MSTKLKNWLHGKMPARIISVSVNNQQTELTGMWIA